MSEGERERERGGGQRERERGERRYGREVREAPFPTADAKVRVK